MSGYYEYVHMFVNYIYIYIYVYIFLQINEIPDAILAKQKHKFSYPIEHIEVRANRKNPRP